MFGPITIFDKSALESLNPDEACWLENFFPANITPIFFVETLADLEKELKDGRTPEQVVGKLAAKTPIASARPNVHHARLCQAELLMGQAIEMRGVPIIAGGVPVQLGDKKGVIYKPSPEEEAFLRWTRGEFLELERNLARQWRQALSGIDLAALHLEFGKLYAGKGKPKSLLEVKGLTDDFIDTPNNQAEVVGLALRFLGAPPRDRDAVIQRWKQAKQPLLRDFAPYTRHVLAVDLFFAVAIAADQIGKERPSNKIDMAYLYYLPFCMVFTSKDNLHARTAPLFVTADQDYIPALELKAELRRLDDFYSSLPQETKDQGITSFATYPPLGEESLVSRLFDKHLPAWRKLAAERKPAKPTKDSAVLKEIMDFQEKATPLPSSAIPDLQGADQVLFSKQVPMKRGKWRIFPPEVGPG